MTHIYSFPLSGDVCVGFIPDNLCLSNLSCVNMLVLAELVSPVIVKVLLLVLQYLVCVGFIYVIVDQKLYVLRFIMLDVIALGLLGKHFLKW